MRKSVCVCVCVVRTMYEYFTMYTILLDRDVPPDVMSFSLTLYNKGKRSKDTEVAELTVELASLTNGEEMDEWYPLSGVTPIGEWGALRLRLR